MLAIRMQRVGRKGHAQFRVIVQDSRFHPSSGRVVAYVGNYNPHSKESRLDTEQVESYLKKGAQPSPRVVKLLKAEKVKLPSWVKEPQMEKKSVKNPDKRRSTRPPEAEKPAEPTPEAESSAEPTEEKVEEPKAVNEEIVQDDTNSEQPAETEEPNDQPDKQPDAEPVAEEPSEPTK